MKNCPSCGEENNAEAKHCQYCGVPLETNLNDPLSSNYQPVAEAQYDYKGIIASLFDWNFDSLITYRIIKFIYALTTIVIILSFIGACLVSFASVSQDGNILIAFGTLVAGFVAFLIVMLFVRIWFELYILFIRLTEDVRSIRDQKRR